MNLARIIAGLIAALLAALMAVPAAAATLSVVGANAKVCQLTGQNDWLTGQPTDAQTLSRYGLRGVDLGFPVESGGEALYLLFGDTVPNGHPPGAYPTVPPDDAVGRTRRTAAPDPKTCLDLEFVGPGRMTLGHPTVTPAIQQGSFNVPTGGVAVDGRIYAFFWTDHCVLPDSFGPNSITPLKLPTPPPGGACPETGVNNSLGASVLAYAAPANPLAFTQVAPPIDITYVPQMPAGFVYVTAAAPAPPSRIPGVDYRPGYEAPIPVFGVARYRQSIPYLALAPRATFGDFTSWKFYAGTGASGPIWISYQQWQSGRVGGQWAPPPGAQLYPNSPNPYSPSGDERCVGEHSVTWNGPLQAWLLLYSCGGWQVEARTAPDPWGPWSAPTVLLSAVKTPSLFCTLFWNKPGLGCPGLVSQQIPVLSFGYFYAPFVISRFTEDATPPGPGPARAATIYWLLSTWDPYQVTVMRSTLKLAP
jgi:hypothetical protein